RLAPAEIDRGVGERIVQLPGGTCEGRGVDRLEGLYGEQRLDLRDRLLDPVFEAAVPGLHGLGENRVPGGLDTFDIVLEIAEGCAAGRGLVLERLAVADYEGEPAHADENAMGIEGLAAIDLQQRMHLVGELLRLGEGRRPARCENPLLHGVE